MITKAKAMELARRKQSEDIRPSNEGLDTSAIGDMAFLLLIFFIVTSSFILRQGLLFVLPPQSVSAQKVAPERLLVVTPLEKGFEFRNKIFTENALKNALKKEARRIKGPVIIIAMNKKLPYERFITVLSMAQELKIGKVSIRREG